MRQEVHYYRDNSETVDVVEFTSATLADRFARQLAGLGYTVEVYRYDTDGRMIGFWSANLGEAAAS